MRRAEGNGRGGGRGTREGEGGSTRRAQEVQGHNVS